MNHANEFTVGHDGVSGAEEFSGRIIAVANPDDERVGDLADGEMVQVHAEGEDILLARVGDEFFAIDNWCTHRDGMLDEGELDGYQVECPLHTGRFDVRTGAPTAAPATRPVRAFAVHREDDDILVGPRGA